MATLENPDSAPGAVTDTAPAAGATVRALVSQGVVDAVPGGVAVLDLEGRTVRVSAGLVAMTGFPAEQLIGLGGPPPWWAEEDRELARTAARGPLERALPGRGEFTLARRDGSRFQARIDTAPLRDERGRTVGVMCVVEDVTERQLAEEAWRESRRTYELIAENSSDVVARLSASMRFLYVSPSAHRVLGYGAETLTGRRLADFVHGDDVGRVRTEHTQISEGADAAMMTFRIRHADGRWLWLEVACFALRDDQGRLLELHISARDVTQRREAEERSRKMAEELGFVARHAGDMISIHDADGAYRQVSDASWGLLDRAPASLLGLDPLAVVHPEDREMVADHLARVRSGDTFVETLTYRAVRPDGSSLWLDTSMRPIHDDDGRLAALICVSRDATARMAAEREAADRADRSDREAAEQTALRRVAMAVATETDASVALAMVADEVPRLLGTDVGLVLRMESARAVVAAAGGTTPLRLGDTVPLETECVLSRMLATDRTARAADLPLAVLHDAAAPVSTVAAPVRVDGTLWGAVVALGHQGHVVPAGAEARLERFAELVSVAVSVADTRARLAAQALTDPLTGLANHRAFHERLREEVSRARRYERPLSLAIIDIDHFKRHNDLHGHQAGDAVLAALALRLSTTARGGELVARVGGEEFAWIVPECEADSASAAVERARQAIRDDPLWAGEQVTVSAGVCSLAHARDADELYRLADGALYWAKANGRDQVCVYSPEVVDALSVEERAQRLERTQTLVALRSLARAVDAKDTSTKKHSERVAALSHRLAQSLGWSADRAALLRDAALLHDVGKLGVPDALLFKAGPLDPAEYEVVKRHAALGAEITSDALSVEQCGWIRHHHEHWDGRGYPDGLAGDEIPEGARIIAVADAWDVMTRARAYGRVRTMSEAVAELEATAGAQFWAPAAQAMIRLSHGPRVLWLA